MVEAAQARTASLQAEEGERLRLTEEGQRKNAQRGMGGLLAWVDRAAEVTAGTDSMKRTLG